MKRLIYALLFILLTSVVSAGLNDFVSHYYKFDHSTEIGIANDTLGRLTLLSATGRAPAKLTGDNCIIGNCSYFNATTTNLNSNGVHVAEFENGSISLWVNSTDTDGFFISNGARFSLGFGGTDGIGEGLATFEVYDGAGSGYNRVRYNMSTNDGAFHHYVGIWEKGGYLILYVDGVQVGNFSYAGKSVTYAVDNRNLSFMSAYNFDNAYFVSGALDELAIWNRTLTAAEVTTLYNSGNGITYENFTISSSFSYNYSLFNVDPITEDTITQLNLSLTWSYYNTTSMTAKLLYNNTLYVGLNISQSISSSEENGTAKFSVNVTTPIYYANNTALNYVWNVTLTNATGNNSFLINDSQNIIWKYARINAKDELDNPITDFNITINNASDTRSFTAETGKATLITNASFNGNWTIAFTHGNYFSKNITNVNMGTNYSITNILQSDICFRAYEKITLNSIDNFSINTTSQSVTATTNISCLNLLAGNYTVDFKNNLSYHNLSKTFEVLPFANRTENFTAYNNQVTVYVRDYFTNNSIDNSTINLTNSLYSFIEYINITGNNFTFNLTNGLNYSIYVDPTGYAVGNTNITNISGLTNNVYVYVFKENSVYIRIYDEETGNLINYLNVTVEFISDSLATSNITDTGALIVEPLIADDYRIRYSSEPTYSERLYFVTITAGTTQTVDVYLLNSTKETNITATVYQENGQGVQNAYIKLLRYYISCNCYKTVEMAQTNFDGETGLLVEYNDELYKVIIEYNDVQYVETTPFKITSDNLNFYINLALPDPTSTLRKIQGIAYNLTYNNNTNNFRFTWSDTNNVVTQACLRVYQNTILTSTGYNETCVNSTAGTILINIAEINGTIYKAVASYSASAETILDTLYVSFNEAARIMGNMGVFLTIFILLAIAFIGIWNSNVLIILTVVILGLASAVGLMSLSFTVVISIVVTGIIVMLMNKS